MKYHLDQEVVTGFISEAKSYLPEIMLGLESFAVAPEHGASIKEAFRYAHIIKGAASMLGFHKISEVAYELEVQLEQLSEQQLALTQERLETLCQNVGELSDLLDTALDDSPVAVPPVTDVMRELSLPTLPATAFETTDFDFSLTPPDAPEDETPVAVITAAPKEPIGLPVLEAESFSISRPEHGDAPTVGELNLDEVAAELKEQFGGMPLPPQPEIPLPSEWMAEALEAPTSETTAEELAAQLAQQLLADLQSTHTAPTVTPPTENDATWHEDPVSAEWDNSQYQQHETDGQREGEAEAELPDLLPLPNLPDLLSQTATTEEELNTEEDLGASTMQSTPSREQTLASLGSESTLLQTDLPEELLEVFLAEAEDHLQIMQTVLRQLEQAPQDLEALQEIRRSAHSLKGTASLVGFRNIMHLAHRMEDLLDLVYEEKFALTVEATHLLTRATDMLEDMSGGQIDETALHDLYADFATLLAKIDEEPTTAQEPALGEEETRLAKLAVLEQMSPSAAALDSIALLPAPTAAADEMPNGTTEDLLTEDVPLETEAVLTDTLWAENNLPETLATEASLTEDGRTEAALPADELATGAETSILELPPLTDEAAAVVNVDEAAPWELNLPDVAAPPMQPEGDAEKLSAEPVQQTTGSTYSEEPKLDEVLDETPPPLLGEVASISSLEAVLDLPVEPPTEETEQRVTPPVLTDQAGLAKPAETIAEPPAASALQSSPLAITPPPLVVPTVSTTITTAPTLPAPTEKVAASPAPPKPVAPHSTQFLRVPIERLDEVVKLIGEIIITRTTFEQRLTDFARQVEEVQIAGTRLRRASSDLETKYEVSTLGGGKARLGKVPAGTANVGNSLVTHNTHGFDDLEFDRYTEFHLLSRELVEASSDIQTVGREFAHLNSDFLGYVNRQGRLYNELQDRLMRLRMVPLSSIATRLQRAVRQASEHENKQAELLLEGEATALDTTALQELIDPLLHLLRNAVAHGLETPAARQAKGKAATGRITLRAFYEGSQVVLQLSDDGHGLDEQKIRDRAVRQGLLSVNEATGRTPAELWPLIFTPGFSTADHVSEIAGRGVGLDVVQTTLQKLKGSIAIASQPGVGTSFTLRLPLTLAVTRALLVKSNEQSFAIPMEVITQIMRLDISKVERIGKEPVMRLGGKIYPLLLLSQLLNCRQSLDDLGIRPPVLLIQVEGREVALIVDQLMGGREIVIKTLGSHLRKVHGVMGATLLGSGEAVLILNLAELVRGTAHSVLRHSSPHLVSVAPASVTTPTLEAPVEPTVAETVVVPTAPINTPISKAKVEEKPLTIMVVDDSPSVRRVNANLIKNTGWIPVQAKDGLEALEKLQADETMPDLMLLDIEMPRMDGYQLLTSLRALPAFRQLPVVIVSSRASEKHRQKAFDLGATDYLVKPYQEEHVVALIRRLAQDGHQ